jgi:DNA-binding LytR/AlgR family response regulator
MTSRTAITAITAIIAEDEPHLARALKDALATTWPELRVVDVVGNGPAAILAVDQHTPDVLFLDIRMPGLTGLQVAERLAASQGHAGPLVVFVTAYNEYAVQAFDREAVDYLVKPVNELRLAETVERLKKRLAAADVAPETNELSRAMELIKKLALGANGATSTPYLKFLRAGIGDTVRIVPVDEVTHLQAQDKYVSLYTADGEQLIRISLKELADQLDPTLFVQVHRSAIVNLRAVVSAERDFTGRVMLTLKGVKDKVHVSRHYAHLFARM